MSTVKGRIYRAAAPVSTFLYSGIGSVLMFHRVEEDEAKDRVGSAHWRISVAGLEAMVQWVRGEGYVIVPIGELVDLLRKGSPVRSKVVALTFDDGYADNYTIAYPLLRGLNAPFTIYLTTGFPDRELVPWWDLVEDHLEENDEVACEVAGVTVRLPTASSSQRRHAFEVLTQAFSAAPARHQMALAQQMFGADKVARAQDAIQLTWEQVSALASDPLVTIGAHTISHPDLARLPEEEAFAEMVGSKRLIESRIGRAVDHFAYPYGARENVGEREFALAGRAGFLSSVTTRLANIFPGHAQGLQALPRLHANTLEDLKLQVSGAVSAFRFRGRRVVMA